MISVMGATGNTGSVVAAHLLAAGREVRVIARSASRLPDLVSQGAVAAAGDATEGEFLR